MMAATRNTIGFLTRSRKRRRKNRLFPCYYDCAVILLQLLLLFKISDGFTITTTTNTVGATKTKKLRMIPHHPQSFSSSSCSSSSLNMMINPFDDNNNHMLTMLLSSSLSSEATGAAAAALPSSVVCAASVSGINALPEIFQCGIFVGYYLLLGVCCNVSINIIDNEISTKIIGLETWRALYVDNVLPCAIGILFVSAGIGQLLVAPQEYLPLVPPPGTWGIWYVPGSSQFHVFWTGMVELICGTSLLFSSDVLNRNKEEEEEDSSSSSSSITSILTKVIKPVSATLLLILTIVITPSNIYMYTHGATLATTMTTTTTTITENPFSLSLSYHYIRFLLQSLLLGTLFVLAKDSLFFAWSDELD